MSGAHGSYTTQNKLPADFAWGYQIEGAYDEDGRLPSIWDTFSKTPGKVEDGTNGDVACDSYHRTHEDIEILKQYGAQVYRFSLSWPRIIPLGGRNDPVNAKGLAFYSKFIDDLHAAGIEPIITLYHWDLPDELLRRYGGALNQAEFVADYANYARIVFKEFGHKVKHWITFNEPWCSSVLGYNTGKHAPGRTSDRTKNPVGDGAREPWIVGKTLLVAHGTAVDIFRKEIKPTHGGEIGITLNGDWAEPWDPEDPADIEACERKIEFAISWFADPIYHGKYPDSMVKQLGDRLPAFTPEEIALVKGSNDFYGMNHYCANYIRHREGEPVPDDAAGNLDHLFEDKFGNPIGPETNCEWLRPNAIGFRRLLKWLSDRYGYPKIYVTENGTSIKGENDLPLQELLEDDFRVQYYSDYIGAMTDASAIDGVNVKMYMAWSLLDNYEWSEGYQTRFGVTFVDYKNGQKRIPKKSALTIGEIFKNHISKD
ncbi:beta-glucosidase [Talaromyces islandicus]|uniref:beta-glucosidase n=1 Tax=Talaromyces islandicus TaxID=28573 RepID=A0A0U1M2R0_TALIS|nr:beta-glucosidase [Talaromyces islandicus]